MTRIAVLVNTCGAVAVTTAVVLANAGSPQTALKSGGEMETILSVGDGVNGYRLTGTPDGLSAFDNGDGTFTLLMHHAAGASRWVISADDLTVLQGIEEPILTRPLFVQVDASEFLGDGWVLRIEGDRVVAMRVS